MDQTSIQLPRVRGDRFPLDGRARHIGRILSLASPVSTSFLDCTAAVQYGQVLVITRIHGSVTGRGATTLTDEIVFRLTDGTNTRDLPIAVPGLLNTEPVKFMLDLKPGNCFALGCAPPNASGTPQTGVKLQCKVTNAGIYFAPTVEGFWISREEARTLGIEPVVLGATSTFAGNGFVGGFHASDTNGATIIPAKTGLSPQIEWMCVFGLAADAAAAQTATLSFFTGQGDTNVIGVVVNKSAATAGMDRLQASNVEINGGYGDLIQAQLSKASTHSIIIGGKYVGHHNTCDPTGVHTGPIAPTGKKFWFYATGTDTNSHQIFASDTGANISTVAHVRGALFGMTKGSGTAAGGMAICTGNDTTTAVAPALGVPAGTDTVTTHVTGTQTILVDDLDLPIAIGSTSTSPKVSLYMNHAKVDGGATFYGTVWGRLRPASEVTQNLNALPSIYKAII